MHEKPKKPTVSETESVLALVERLRLLKEERSAIREKMDQFSDDEESDRETKEERDAYTVKHKALMEEYKLSSDEMRLVIEYKKAKSGPERKLNCRVFEDIKSDEFRECLKSIIENGETGQRFQAMMQDPKKSPEHWSTADILVDKEGIRILHFDAINATNNRKGGLDGDILEEVLKSLESSKPISLVDTYMEVDGKIVALQRDSRSCSLFATGVALDMSKIPHLHELAKEHAVRFEDSPVKNNVTRYSIDAIYLPASFVRNTQLPSLIDYYEKHQSEALSVIPKKSGPKKLKEYVDSRSHQLQNLGLLHSRKHYKEIVDEKKQENIPKKK